MKQINVTVTTLAEAVKIIEQNKGFKQALIEIRNVTNNTINVEKYNFFKYVLEFIDHITGTINIRLEEILFKSLPDSMQNKSIRELEIRNKTGANIIGFKSASGDYIINPSPDTVMMQDAKLFVLGTQEQVSKFKEILK